MKKIAVILLMLALSSMAWAQRSKTIPKLYTSQRLRIPNVTSCPTSSPTPKEGEICWDKDDDVLKVWNGSSYTSVSTPAGSFAVNTGDSFSGTNTFTSLHNVHLGVNAGRGIDEDRNLLLLSRASGNRTIYWDESEASFEFSWDATHGDGEDVTITDTELFTPLLSVGSGDAAEDITITFDDSDVDMAMTWDDSEATLEFDFDGVLANKADVTITTDTVQIPTDLVIGTGADSADFTITFDNGDADPTIFWDDSADVLAITSASLKHATCAATEAATVTIDACDVVTITGTGAPVFTLNTCGATQQGRILYVVCGADASVLDDTGGNLQLAGDFTCTADDVLTLICEGSTGDWLEVTRSAN